MDFDNGAEAAIGNCITDVIRFDPAEYPVGFVRPHVDTAVAHGCAKIFVPVGAVEGMSLRGKEGRPGNAGEHIIIYICKKVASGFAAEVAVAHVFGRDFIHNGKFSGWRGGWNACAARGVARHTGGNIGLKNEIAVFISI